MITITYVIPTYNNLMLLKRCLSSILPQLEEGDKIIIVDDGSTDGTFKYINENYNNKNILIVEQANSGSGSARNKGINMSDTDFLWFVDSDDYLLEGSCKKAKDIIIKNKYDLLFFNYIIKENDIESVKLLNIDPKNKLQLMLGPHFSWNKIINKRLFLNVRFPHENIRYQDHGIIPAIISQAKNIGYVCDSYYFYDFNHSNNISKNISKSDDMYAAFDHLVKYHNKGLIQKSEMELLFIQTFIFSQLFNTPSLKFRDVYTNSCKVKYYLMDQYPTWRKSPYLKLEFVTQYKQNIDNLSIKVIVGKLFKYDTFSVSVIIYVLKLLNTFVKGRLIFSIRKRFSQTQKHYSP